MADQAVRVIKPADRAEDAASGPMTRQAAIAERTVGARRLWFGFVHMEAGSVSAAHHHGEAESGIYVVSGRARFYWGDGLEHVEDAEPGDFVWVPPHVVHVEQNPGDQAAVVVVARSTQETLVFNVPTPPGWNPDAPI